jgi:tetratricopeptide (TPR) repeat protein
MTFPVSLSGINLIKNVPNYSSDFLLINNSKSKKNPSGMFYGHTDRSKAWFQPYAKGPYSTTPVRSCYYSTLPEGSTYFKNKTLFYFSMLSAGSLLIILGYILNSIINKQTKIQSHKELEEINKLFESGEVAKAENRLNDLILKDPEVKEIFDRLNEVIKSRIEEIIFLFHTGEEVNKEKSLHLLKSLIDSMPQLAHRWAKEYPELISEYYFFLGRKYISENKYEKAINFYKLAVETNPKNASARNILTMLLAAGGAKPQVSINEYKKVIEDTDDLKLISHAYENIAHAYYDLKKFDDALANAKEAIDKDSTRVLAYFYAGNAMKSQGYYDEALDYYARALKINGINFKTPRGQNTTQKLINSAINECEKNTNLTLNDVLNKQRDDIKLELNIRDKPTPYVYALLSQRTYDPDRDDNTLKDWDKVATSQDLLKDSQFAKNDYFGIAYRNKNTNELVIAHRGTKTLKDLKSDMHIALGKVPEHYEPAKLFLTRVKEKYGNPYISHTGHSLGAVLAELLAYEDGTSAVTFDSPGTRNILENLRGTEFDNQRIDVITFMSTPNFINTATTHVGQLIQIFPSRDPGSLPEELIKRASSTLIDKAFVVDEKSSTFEKIDLSIQSTKGHSIDRIVAVFNPNTGFPDNQKQIASWPTGINQYLQYMDFAMSHGGKFDSDITELTNEKERFILSKSIGYETTEYHQNKISLNRLSHPVANFLNDYYLYFHDNKPLNESSRSLLNGLNDETRKVLNTSYYIENGQLVCYGLLAADEFKYYIMREITKAMYKQDNIESSSSFQPSFFKNKKPELHITQIRSENRDDLESPKF